MPRRPTSAARWPRPAIGVCRRSDRIAADHAPDDPARAAEIARYLRESRSHTIWKARSKSGLRRYYALLAQYGLLDAHAEADVLRRRPERRSRATRSFGLSDAARCPDWPRFVTGSFDLVVVGGGIIGAGVARDAALRGLSVALFEKADYGGGTTSGSTRLIHGGLRYLEMFDFRLVRLDLREREILLPDCAASRAGRSNSCCRSTAWIRSTGTRMRAGPVPLYDLLSYDKSLPVAQKPFSRRGDQARAALSKRGLKGAASVFRRAGVAAQAAVPRKHPRCLRARRRIPTTTPR